MFLSNITAHMLLLCFYFSFAFHSTFHISTSIGGGIGGKIHIVVYVASTIYTTTTGYGRYSTFACSGDGSIDINKWLKKTRQERRS